jgi:hypothetical protein
MTDTSVPYVKLTIRPCELKDANAFVAALHRHHKPVVGHRFSIKVVDDQGKVRGVAIVGRPVARKVDQSKTLEVTRLCTDGARNACSMLYQAAARAGKALGYEKIQTYILESESGTSLVACGWKMTGRSKGGAWSGVLKSGKMRNNDHPLEAKQRWERLI